MGLMSYAPEALSNLRTDEGGADVGAIISSHQRENRTNDRILTMNAYNPFNRGTSDFITCLVTHPQSLSTCIIVPVTTVHYCSQCTQRGPECATSRIGTTILRPSNWARATGATRPTYWRESRAARVNGRMPS
ncbi:hypothetical protein EVAR_40385_1 [Eumeta japonica]|uniref:Uncharacterized protein n=1 Tax=Eumeta variegata TaxID=151549 RepID=A0A4C1WA99_EUMVA|nr:hypothetical protein EVAR_40385_1 [Eumeta japonica]